MMNIYNTKEKVEPGKLKNVKFVKKWRKPGNGIELNAVFKDINILRNRMEGVVTLGQDPHRQISNLGKAIKDTLRACCVDADINPRTPKAEAGRSLILGQPGLQRKFQDSQA